MRRSDGPGGGSTENVRVQDSDIATGSLVAWQLPRRDESHPRAASTSNYRQGIIRGQAPSPSSSAPDSPAYSAIPRWLSSCWPAPRQPTTTPG